MMEKTKSACAERSRSKIVENYFEKLKQEFEPKAPAMTRDELVSLIREIITEELIKIRSELTSLRQPSSDSEFLSVKEAAIYLNLAVATMYEKTSAKQIPFHKRDKKLYFKKEELKDWLLRKKTDANIIKLPMPKKHKRAA